MNGTIDMAAGEADRADDAIALAALRHEVELLRIEVSALREQLGRRYSAATSAADEAVPPAETPKGLKPLTGPTGPAPYY